MGRGDEGEGRSDRLAAARILNRYRRLILLGRLAVTHEAARRFVGPDSAYHLYGRGNVKPPNRGQGRRRRRRAVSGGRAERPGGLRR